MVNRIRLPDRCHEPPGND